MGNSVCCKKDTATLEDARGNKLPGNRSRIDTHITYRADLDRIKSHFTFKDFKGFKHINNINELYKMDKVLGKGTFGEVKRAQSIKGGFICAVKVIDKAKLDSNDVYKELMMNELKVLQATSHPHIMSIFELLEDDDNYYVVSEFIRGGELFERIVQLKHFNEAKAVRVIGQILLALNYIHNNNIMHRDLKPENILLESELPDNLDIKLSDFGFATYLKPEGGENLQCGSPLYMAPEIIRCEDYTDRVDIWSTGVIAYILLCGRPPFGGKNKNEIYRSIKSSPLTFNDAVWGKVSKHAIDFIRQALNREKT